MVGTPSSTLAWLACAVSTMPAALNLERIWPVAPAMRVACTPPRPCW